MGVLGDLLLASAWLLRLRKLNFFGYSFYGCSLVYNVSLLFMRLVLSYPTGPTRFEISLNSTFLPFSS